MTEPKTSISHPIRLDLIDGAVAGVPGRIGMTFAPGKQGVGMHGHWQRDLQADLARLRQLYRVDTLVCLVEDHELAELRIADLPEQVITLGMACVRFPIVDVSVPRDEAAFDVAVRDMVTRLRAGETVAMHCKGGLGRTGLVAACCLVALGLDPAMAICTVRQARPGTIETALQEAFVRAFRLT